VEETQKTHKRRKRAKPPKIKGSQRKRTACLGGKGNFYATGLSFLLGSLRREKELIAVKERSATTPY